MENTITLQNNHQSKEMDKAIMQLTFEKHLDKHAAAIKHALVTYHMPQKNNLVGQMDKVELVFLETFYSLDWIVPILEEVVSSQCYGIEDVFASVYGDDSDEIYMLRAFLEKFENIQSWTEADMWNGCKADARLAAIITK